MAGHKKSGIYNDIQELTDVRKSLENKNPVFVPLNGLSQSAKDRRMNNRTVRQPKNVNLVEGYGDPADKMEFSNMKVAGFPEYQLSSTIKEANGMDFSNHSIEQYYCQNQKRSRSVSPEISEGDTSNPLSVTDESSHSSKYQGETSSSYLSNLTESGSSNTENELLIELEDSNEVDCSVHDVEREAKNDVIRRFSKNAAIMGLLRNKLICVDDFNENDNQETKFSSLDKGEMIEDQNDNHNIKDINDNEKKKPPTYPSLVPHPEDPDLYIHPLQAYGKVDDEGIDFTLRSSREKTIITPRQHYIRQGLKDDAFKFETKKSDTAPKPNAKFSFPSMTLTSRSPTVRDQNPFSSRPSSSRNSSISITQDDDIFIISDVEFPAL